MLLLKKFIYGSRATEIMIINIVILVKIRKIEKTIAANNKNKLKRHNMKCMVLCRECLEMLNDQIDVLGGGREDVIINVFFLCVWVFIMCIFSILKAVVVLFTVVFLKNENECSMENKECLMGQQTFLPSSYGWKSVQEKMNIS